MYFHNHEQSGGILERANYEPTFKMLWKMFVWNNRFDNENKREIFQQLNEYHHKLFILKNSNESNTYF
jgi:hypothetical protein